MKRSPWFNALRQPPVNGGPDAMYERRCRVHDTEVWMSYKAELHFGACSRCEWRGILREHDGPGGVVSDDGR